MANLTTQGIYDFDDKVKSYSKPKPISLKPIIDGYFIHRPTHVEINIKSPYLANLMKNDRDLVYTDFGMVYDVDFNDNMSLYNVLNKNNSVFLTSSHEPNITFLRSPKLEDGFKTKIKGIIFPEDLVTYEHKFNTVVNNLVTFLTKPKLKPLKHTGDRLQKLKSIRAGLIYDGYGWVHNSTCSCEFGYQYQTISLCDICDSYGVLLSMNNNNDIKPLGVCN